MYISPMLLETATEAFDSKDHIFEPKIDGHRLILSCLNGNTKLYTRHRTDCTKQYPELIVDLGYDVILDGEVACTNAAGEVCYESVMERFSTKRAKKAYKLSLKQPANLVVFDVLFLKGVDLRGLPLIKRKGILQTLKFPRSIASISYFDEGIPLYKQICDLRMEGIVAKKRESIYVSARSSSWQKIINWMTVNVIITGYRKREFGWLASIKDNDHIRPAGIIELGASPEQKKAFYGVSQQLKISENDSFVYLEPRIAARVKIRNWSRKGFLRSPVFIEFAIKLS
jgi:DNA ligase 1